VEDIDAQPKEAHSKAFEEGRKVGIAQMTGHPNARASGWNYRDAVLKGWNGAIRKIRDMFDSIPALNWNRDDFLYKLEELQKANDVPEPELKREGHAPPMSSEAIVNLQERMRELETRMLDMIEPRLKTLESGFKEHVGTWMRQHNAMVERIDDNSSRAALAETTDKAIIMRVETLEAAMRGHNEQVGGFEKRMNEALSKALQRVNERLEYLERQEKLTLGCFEEQDGKIKNLQNEQVKLQNWRERIIKA
jgi:chromosome segregation ATPase